MELPNLSGVADAANVSQKGAGNFTADYINWARTLQDIRDHAPGWMPECVEDDHGKTCHTAPDGSKYLLIRFIHIDGAQTTCIPHAIMDNKMRPILGDSVSARDIADGFVRGACKAGAALFGYAWQMWSKDDPMERNDEIQPNRGDDSPKPKPSAKKVQLTEEVDVEEILEKVSAVAKEINEWRAVECPLGKHRGKSLGEIADNDESYFRWMLGHIEPKTEELAKAFAAAEKAFQDNGKQEFNLVG
jgi:hypothetical protein